MPSQPVKATPKKTARPSKPMTEVPEFSRSPEEACAEEGHLITSNDVMVYCLRCSYTG